MDVIASPFVTVILNLIASVLVSKGILDGHSTVAFVQIGNSLIAGVMTTIIGVVSVWRLFDLHKHNASVNAPSIVTPSQRENIDVPIEQTGLPKSK